MNGPNVVVLGPLALFVDVARKRTATRPRISQPPLELNKSACPLSKVGQAREELAPSTQEHRVIRVEVEQWRKRGMGEQAARHHRGAWLASWSQP
jgi:hypothetical protein